MYTPTYFAYMRGKRCFCGREFTAFLSRSDNSIQKPRQANIVPVLWTIPRYDKDNFPPFSVREISFALESKSFPLPDAYHQFGLEWVWKRGGPRRHDVRDAVVDQILDWPRHPWPRFLTSRTWTPFRAPFTTRMSRPPSSPKPPRRSSPPTARGGWFSSTQTPGQPQPTTVPSRSSRQLSARVFTRSASSGRYWTPGLTGSCPRCVRRQMPTTQPSWSLEPNNSATMASARRSPESSPTHSGAAAFSSSARRFLPSAVPPR